MRGFVPTPPHLVDSMVGKLFRGRPPRTGDTLLDPGCGTGAFIEGVLRWCAREGTPIPAILGVDSNPALLTEARRRIGGHPQVDLVERDFLEPHRDQSDYIIGNPPYVPITGLDAQERASYRRRFRTAVGRFDLYLLFFEQALRLLRPRGRLVFITPEKFIYVQTAEPLRRALVETAIEEVEFIAESAFGDLVTYPTITTLTQARPAGATRIVLRDGTTRKVKLRSDSSWLPLFNGNLSDDSGPTLRDAAVRISCGVATGADQVFVLKDSDVPGSLRRHAFRTLSGRRLVPGERVHTTHSILVPYERDGSLLPADKLGPLGDYLKQAARRKRLLQRTCVVRKPWYAFHENPPLSEILQPKILCKDIGARPWFVVDADGDIVPRHSLYYIVPAEPAQIDDLCDYLNSPAANAWLTANCQRAANGFVRLQSHVLKRTPVPERFVVRTQLACV